ncbi:hypothetical protein B0O99DRAFT_648117 [Bisporella sp. PMI_857]|nr:hypothetical protein B0O99DRAFT_648117 [Bisporella sp. PMI_857]
MPEAGTSLDQRESRRASIRNAKPFSSFLTDTFQRQHDYLRISITEKCNLRCLYCMPEEGVPQSPPPDLLTTPEIFLLSSTFVSQGVTKIRLTGGEPTVRRDILPLMHQIGSLRSKGLRELCLTSNGISLQRKLDSMVEAGLTGVNLSLDTLDPWQFQVMTRRKGFEAVMKSIERILEMNKFGAGIKLKINCVVMRGINDREILPFVELSREQNLEVRFIEYMPFDGNKWNKGKMLPYQEMLDIIRSKYPDLRKVQDHKNDTSKTYEIPGFVGRMGFITSMTHNFCGTCNRLRITSDGNLKVCLFGNAEVSLRDILRKSNQGNPIDERAFEALKLMEHEWGPGLVSSSDLIGGMTHEKELLDVIGLAVKGKKEKHAGIGELENMKNRPMILIGGPCHENSSHNGDGIYLEKLPGSRARAFSTSSLFAPPKLTHLTTSGTVHMVDIAEKDVTSRTAVAVCSIYFSNSEVIPLIKANQMKKGDVLGVARIAGIMAAKKTSELIPLCHPVGITSATVDLKVQEPKSVDLQKPSAQSLPGAGTDQEDSYKFHTPSGHVFPKKDQGHRYGSINITASVSCDGKTGVEMEALTACSTAALAVYDMCKAVDKRMRIENLHVVEKSGGRSGHFLESPKERGPNL